MSKKEEIYKLLIQGKTTREIADLLNLNIRTVQKHKKIFNEVNEQGEHKSEWRTTNKKQNKEIAKAMLITGQTVRKVADKVGLSKSVIGYISNKENLKQTQLEFLNSLRESKIQEIESNKLKRLKVNSDNLEIIKKIVEVGEFNRNLQVALLENEKTEQEILELNRLERLERFEFSKEIYTNKLKIDVLEKIKTMTDEELKDLIAYMENKNGSK